MSLSPLAPLSDIHLAPLTREDWRILRTQQRQQQQQHVDEKKQGDEYEYEYEYDDEDDEYDEEEALETLEAFEAAWKMEIFPNTANGNNTTVSSSSLTPLLQTPLGERETRIVQLQTQASAIQHSKDALEVELKKQAAFLRRGRDRMEASYAAQTQDVLLATSRMTKLQHHHQNDDSSSGGVNHPTQQYHHHHHHHHNQRLLDSVATVSRVSQSTLPWKLFLSNLDNAAALASGETTQSNNHNDKDENDNTAAEDWTISIGIGKPSARALHLAEAFLRLNDTASETSNNNGEIATCSSMLVLYDAAYRIDQILLRQQVNMLEADIDRWERLGVLHEEAGRLMKDLNPWDLLDDDAPQAPQHQQQEGGVILVVVAAQSECQLPVDP